jgi:hypothetical protein
MQPLTCPIPANINPLQTNGFLFGITKLPEISFFCQEVTLPELQAPAAEMPTPLVSIPIPGEKLTFGDLTVTFLISEDMANYIAVHNWMVGLGFPETHEQYRNFIRTRSDSVNTNELTSGYSDGTLQILNSSNNAARTIRFTDLFPTSLTQLQLQSTVTDVSYLAASATFMYTTYRFE